MPLNVVLYEPEIAPNTGKLLDSVRILALTTFNRTASLGRQALTTSGLRLPEWADVKQWPCFESFYRQLSEPIHLFAFTTKGNKSHHQNTFQANDSLLLGRNLRIAGLDWTAYSATKFMLTNGGRSQNFNLQTVLQLQFMKPGDNWIFQAVYK